MKKTLLFAGLLLSQSIFGQVTNFQKEFNSINEHLMLGLGSYAVANFAISGVGYFTSEDESSKRFHEMNVMWNTVNIGLALPGYIKGASRRTADDQRRTVEGAEKDRIHFFIQ